MPKLIVTEIGKGEEKVFPIGREARIGRLPESDVPLAEAGVSREHAKIIQEENQFYLLDLESGNGTLLNGLSLKPHEKTILKNNDRITINNYHLRFFLTDEIFDEALKEEEEITNADILEVKLLKKVLDAVDQETVPSLEVLNGVAEGQRFFLTDDIQEMTLGRGEDCDFSINEFVVSRRHAKIARGWGGIALTDLESKNGTYVNNRRITEEFLHDGDRIALGTIVFLFRNPQEINLKELGEEIAKSRSPLSPKAAVKPKARAKKEEPEEFTEEGSAEEAAEILKGLPALKPAPANIYPLPQLHEKKWTPLEIGLLGLGVAVLLFALLTLAHLVVE